MTKPRNLADLGILAGVSTATVSRALAGHPSVKATTRDRILALAREHDVRPNQLARNLRLRHTGAIGVAMPLGQAGALQLTDPFFLTLLGLLADGLADHGYDILLSRVQPSSPDWLDRLVDSGRTDGVILIGQADHYDAIERIAERYAPLVVWGAHRDGQAQLTIGSDNRAGGWQAAEHLLAGGRRRLLFVGDPAPPEFADRLAGFRAAAAAADCMVEVVATAMAPDRALAAMRDRLATGPAPDGIFAATDVVAMSVLQALAGAGIAVPEAAAVVGYDDITLAAQMVPPLTTIRQDLESGARAMIAALMRRIAGEPARALMLPPDLIVRASTRT